MLNPAGTYTGRPNSAQAFYVPHSTNLHNLVANEARRDPLFAVRDCIVPDEGEVFLYADLSQAEAKIVACLTEEPELLALDQHRWIASMLYDKPMDAVTAHERQVGKASHKINYGIGAKRLWQDINSVADITGISVTLTQAKSFLANVHAKRPKLDGIWWNRVERQVKEVFLRPVAVAAGDVLEGAVPHGPPRPLGPACPPEQGPPRLPGDWPPGKPGRASLQGFHRMCHGVPSWDKVLSAYASSASASLQA